MLTLRVFVWVLILIVFEFTFLCRCADPPEQQKECYYAGYDTICFFRPYPKYKWVTWQEAWQTCRRKSATLPAIPNEAAQKAFERYMDFLKLVDRDDFWMAGQEVRGLEWKWLNGRNANLTGRQLNGKMGDDYAHGVLANDMLYRTENPSKINNFACQLFGTACRSNTSIALSNGCLLLDSNETLNLYDARNRCIKEGGDLVVLDKPEDLYRFREVISRIPRVSKVWIGLQRQWWTWNSSGAIVEMKYSNWLPYHGFIRNQTCMMAEMKRYKWQQESCSSSKLFVCQKLVPVPLKGEPRPISVLNPTPFIVFTALGVFIIVVPIILVVIVMKRRKARLQQSDAVRFPSDRSYQDLHDRQENQYTDLQGITHQQSQLSSDYQNLSDYDDVGVTAIPNYLDIIE